MDATACEPKAEGTVPHAQRSLATARHWRTFQKATKLLQAMTQRHLFTQPTISDAKSQTVAKNLSNPSHASPLEESGIALPFMPIMTSNIAQQARGQACAPGADISAPSSTTGGVTGATVQRSTHQLPLCLHQLRPCLSHDVAFLSHEEPLL